MTVTGRNEGHGSSPASLRHDGPEPTLVGIAAVGLAGSRRFLAGGPARAADGARLIARCAAEGLSGMLAAAVNGGTVALDGDGDGRHGDGEGVLADRASEAAAEAARAAAVVTGETLALSAALAAAGIDHRVLDGPALVPRVYADAGLRPFAAAEVAVAPEAGDRARALAGPGVRVRTDLLPSEAGPRLRLADLGDAPVPVAVDGGTLPGLPLDVALLRAAVVAAGAGSRRLLALRDVAQIALAGPLPGEAARARADGWRCAALLAAGVHAAWDTFDLADKTDLSVWAAHYGDPPFPGPGRRLRHALGRWGR